MLQTHSERAPIRSAVLTEVNYKFDIGCMHAIEIQQTATPSLHHLSGLRRFRNLMEDDKLGSLLLVCNVRERTALPDRITAIPWHAWPHWMQQNLSE